MKSDQVVWRVQAPEQIRVEALEPGNVELRNRIGRLESAGIERLGDDRKRRSAVRSANRLRPAVDPRDGGVRATGGQGGHLSKVRRDIRHVAGHCKDNL